MIYTFIRYDRRRLLVTILGPASTTADKIYSVPKSLIRLSTGGKQAFAVYFSSSKILQSLDYATRNMSQKKWSSMNKNKKIS